MLFQNQCIYCQLDHLVPSIQYLAHERSSLLCAMQLVRSVKDKLTSELSCENVSKNSSSSSSVSFIITLKSLRRHSPTPNIAHFAKQQHKTQDTETLLNSNQYSGCRSGLTKDSFQENKKAVLSQRLPRNAPYIWVP